MIKAENSIKEFIRLTEGKQVIAFAASPFLKVISFNYPELQLSERISYIVDNDVKKHGNQFALSNGDKQVVPIDNFLNENLSEVVLLVAAMKNGEQIIEQLEQYEKLRDVLCFSLSKIIEFHVDDHYEKPNVVNEENIRIPKKIHCFWFSGSKKDDMAEKCIESWRKYCPDYEIYEWTEKNYDVTQNAYMYEAYQNKKWAYAADYARLERLYNEGGIYFDLDLELIDRIDFLLENSFFAGFGPIRDIELAAFGAEKGNPLVKRMLDSYKNRHFEIKENLTLMDVQPVYMDHFMVDNGFRIDGKYQSIDNNTLYPRELFSARNWFTGEEYIHKNSVGMHHCVGSWYKKK